jgi:multidrug efflux pump
VFNTRFYNWLRKVIEWCILRRKTVIAATVLSLVLGGLGMGLTEKQFFPSSNRIELMADLWLPEGASIRATEREAARLERLLEGDPGVASYVTYVGNGSPRFFLSLDQQLFRTNFAQVIVLTKDIAAREQVIAKLRQALADDFPGVRGRVNRVPLGPPVNYPVQFRVLGEDAPKLKEIAERVAEKMRANPHTVDVHPNWGDRVLALRVDVDQEKARALGVSSQSVSRAVAAVVSGSPLGQYRENDRLIDVVLRAPAQERGSLAALGELAVPATGSRSVPLTQVANVVEALEEPILWRRSRELALTVRADIVDGAQAPDVTTAIEPTLAQIRASLPAGYRIEAGGAFEENAKAQASIAAGLPMVLAVIFALLMLQLKSFSRSLMVLLTAPLGIVGVALALLVFGKPFGFVAMLGAIALGGMIMRNSVILVDQIEQDVAAGYPVWVAIREAVVRRFRPITLTAAAAVLAMIPLARSVLWGPMAYAIMGGLIVATVLTLVFVPALYAAWFGVRASASGAVHKEPQLTPVPSPRVDDVHHAGPPRHDPAHHHFADRVGDGACVHHRRPGVADQPRVVAVSRFGGPRDRHRFPDRPSPARARPHCCVGRAVRNPRDVGVLFRLRVGAASAPHDTFGGPQDARARFAASGGAGPGAVLRGRLARVSEAARG